MDIETGEIPPGDSKKLKHNEDTMIKNTSHIFAGSTSGSLDSNHNNSSNSDLSFHEDQNNDADGMNDDADGMNDDVDGMNDCDDMSDYGDEDDDENDFLYLDDDDDDGDYLSMQAQFDNVDLPAGVEATVSWLNEPAPSSKVPSQISSSSNIAGSQTLNPDSGNSHQASAESSSCGKEEATDEDVMKKYESFKHFDVVDDFSDHHYCNLGFQGHQPPKTWSKKVQDEWKILESDLPDTIYVRVYESRMDLLRAVIIGPQGTPYHDGLFVFDVLFPPAYPDVPPMVYYYSGGLRLNPNLYDCGKVCLSLLNTWTGHGNEKWIPQSSTMLQVLVSIQALILNSRPFFNEPGYETSYRGAEGERKSKAYNEDVFILSLKTITYTLRRPPRHFKDLVVGHFCRYAVDILSACKAYIGGAPVGSLVKGKEQGDTSTADRSSPAFREAVSKMMNGLVSIFSKNGAKDCEQFRI